MLPSLCSFQAAGMFVGELLCLFAFYILRCRARATGTKFDEAKPFNPFLFVIPAICDMSATSFMYLGLSLTDASIFQMLRGSVVIFTSLLRIFVLKKRLGIHEWIGIVLVIGGTAIVGSQSNVCPEDGGACSSSSGASSATIGNILIILAQIIVSIQMVS
jgi:drug/metabolite transporter (DMT)-like permease